MSTIDFTKAYIDRLCKEIGTRADAIYNARTCAWYFARGTSTIEVFMTNMGESGEPDRVFIRCIASICPLPANPVTQFELLQKALELNTKQMGIKLGTIADKGLLCVIAERDIEGMDYQEFVTLISDISFWADHLENHLQEHFGKL
jgi:hypothetical protein